MTDFNLTDVDAIEAAHQWAERRISIAAGLLCTRCQEPILPGQLVRERIAMGGSTKGHVMCPSVLAPRPRRTPGVNPFPPHLVGLRRLRATPYPYKERWPEAPFGNRWRALKARTRSAAPTAEMTGEGTR